MEEQNDKDWNERFERAQRKPGASRVYVGGLILLFTLMFGMYSRHPIFLLPGLLGTALIVSGLRARKARVPPESE